jgi:hypothetical protein
VRAAALIRCPGSGGEQSPVAEKGGKMHMDVLALGRGGFFAIMIIVGVVVVGYTAWVLLFKLGK